ncbi:MAG: aminomethyltransferase beta-barrel domain-containing protein [Segetibacter sp.]
MGQRKGLEIAMGRPVFVTKIIPESNTVVLGDSDDLNESTIMVGKLNMGKYDSITPGTEAIGKIRYKDSGNLCNMYPENDGLRVSFYENVKGIAPGQSAVFYEGDDVIAGGIIQRSGF